MKKTVALLSFVVLLGAGCATTNRPAVVSTPSSVPSAEAVATSSSYPAKVEILMDENGFRPANIKIPKEVKVVFKNIGQETVWPASDPHPIHTDYAAFDPKGGIKPGETFEITFPEPKVYRFHDHVSPFHRGSITVE